MPSASLMILAAWSPSSQLMACSRRFVIATPHIYPPACGSSLAPILFGLSPDRRCLRIFDLHPVRRPAGAIQRAEPLRHDALAAELAGVLENDLAVALVMLIEYDAELRLAHQLGQFPLAILNRRAV